MTNDVRNPAATAAFVALAITLAACGPAGGSQPVPHAPPVPDHRITAAMDLDNASGLGPAWSPTDGEPAYGGPNEHIYVTPCDVLVSSYDPSGADWETTPDSALRISGYALPSGAKLWSHMLKDIMGKDMPELRAGGPTYTADCHMILPVAYGTAAKPQAVYATLIVTLLTGETVLHDGGGFQTCLAAGDKWMGCHYQGGDTRIASVNLDDLGSPVWQKDSFGSYYTMYGDVVVAGGIWTGAGYGDPATGDIMFGSDGRIGYTEDPGVIYVEPRRLGGYQSGLAVRVEGPVAARKEGTCQVMAWDTATDRAMWAQPGNIPCGDPFASTDLIVAGQWLVATRTGWEDPPEMTTIVFTWADGRVAWTSEDEREPLGRGLGFDGLMERYAAFHVEGPLTPIGSNNNPLPRVLRLSDGAEVATPDCREQEVCQLVAMASDTAYIVEGERAGTIHLVAYALNQASPAESPHQRWAVPVGGGLERANWTWTFAVNGAMYLVYNGPEQQTLVALVEV